MCIKIDQDSQEKVKALQKQETIISYSVKIKFAKLTDQPQVFSLCRGYLWEKGLNTSSYFQPKQTITATTHQEKFESESDQKGFHLFFELKQAKKLLKTQPKNCCIIACTIQTKDILQVGTVSGFVKEIEGTPCFTAKQAHWDGTILE